MKHLFPLFWSTLLLLSNTACFNWEFTEEPPTESGYRPIYLQVGDVKTYSILPPENIQEPGKIYVFGSYLLVNDQNRGVHLIDNRDPENPSKKAFISIPLNRDIAVKDFMLYADNQRDMLVFDIRNPESIQFVKRIENAFPQNLTPNTPPESNVYFECVDPDRGVVIAWEWTNDLSDNVCFN